MTEQEYNERMNKIEKAYQDEKKRLYIDFALSNAIYVKGDIIRSHSITLLIDRITVHKSLGLPMPVYNGVELKKDLTPKAKNNRVAIYGNDGVTKVN